MSEKRFQEFTKDVLREGVSRLWDNPITPQAFPPTCLLFVERGEQVVIVPMAHASVAYLKSYVSSTKASGFVFIGESWRTTTGSPEKAAAIWAARKNGVSLEDLPGTTECVMVFAQYKGASPTVWMADIEQDGQGGRKLSEFKQESPDLIGGNLASIFPADPAPKNSQSN